MLFDPHRPSSDRSTGHAKVPGARFSDQTMHLRLARDSDVNDDKGATKKGILITRFHYEPITA